MTMLVQQKANNADTAVTRTDVVRLLQEVESLEQLDVSGQDLRGINLMKGANLSQARVSEANLCGTELSNADLHGADLSGTYLCWADLRGANLRAADLREADLSWADLRAADLREANLDRATLYGASLGRADLGGTSLGRADLRGADLSWASFGGASTYEQVKNRLRHRGAIFREKTNVKVIVRFADEEGRYVPGLLLGFLFMSVVGFLCVLGVRVILMHIRQNKHFDDEAPHQVRPSPGCRS